MGTLVAYRGDKNSFLGCVQSYIQGGLSLSLTEVPIVRIKDRLLIGVLNSQSLYQYLLTGEIIFPDTSYKTILTSLRTAQNIKDFSSAVLLIVSIIGDIYHWQDGLLYQIDNEWIAIGDGKDYAMGALFGMKSTSIPPKSKIEIALECVRLYSPYDSKTMKVEAL